MFCSQCGNKLPDGARFCGRCGQKVVNRTPEPEPVYEAPAPEQIPAAAPARVSPSMMRFDRMSSEESGLERPEPPVEHPAETPTVEEPVFEEPATETSEAEEIVHEEPAHEEPAVEAPAYEEQEETPQPVFERSTFRDPIPEEASAYMPPQPKQPVDTAPPVSEPRFERRIPEPAAPEAMPYQKKAPVQPMREDPVDQPAFLPEKEPEVPEENRPLSPWAYFGYSVLFAIPVIGWILLIVFSLAPKNVNLKNFTRSYWLWIIVLLAITLVVLILIMTGVLRGPIEVAVKWLRETGLNWIGEHLAQ